MNIIEQLDPVSFSNYLKKYHNTICGRHPIGVLLNVSIVVKWNNEYKFSSYKYMKALHALKTVTFWLILPNW